MNNIKRDLLELDTICGRLSSIKAVFSLILTAFENEEAATQHQNSEYYRGIVCGFGLCEDEITAIYNDMFDILGALLKENRNERA